MAKRESYIDSMAGMPDGTQDTAGKDESQEVRETSENLAISIDGISQEQLEAAASLSDGLEAVIKRAIEFSERLRLAEIQSLIGHILSNPTVSSQLKILSGMMSQEDIISEITKGIDSKNIGISKTKIIESCRDFNFSSGVPVYEKSIEKQLRDGISKRLKIDREPTRQQEELLKIARDLFLSVHLDLMPMDSRRLDQKQLDEASDIYRDAKSFFDARGIQDIHAEVRRNREGYFSYLWQIKEWCERIAKPIGDLNGADYPLDKVNMSIWGQLDGLERRKDGFYCIPSQRKGSENEIDILYKIDFSKKEKELESLEGLNGLPELTARTKRVMIAMNELYKKSSVITKAQIYHAMGYEGVPGKADLDMIERELSLLLSEMTLDNSQEVDANYRYDHFKYAGAIVPHERIEAEIKGKPVADAIHMFRQPPLMSFAEQRNQITRIPMELLRPIRNRTKQVYEIEDYLITRISRIKNSKDGKVSNKLLYETIFKNCGITEWKQKARAREKIKDILAEYKKQNFIKGFTDKKDYITIKR